MNMESTELKQEDPLEVIKRCINSINNSPSPDKDNKIKRMAAQYNGIDITNGYRIIQEGGRLALTNRQGVAIS